MRKITLKSYAKFNPVLEVLGRDPANGYHFVSTIMTSIDHFDLVTVERLGEPMRIDGVGELNSRTNLEVVLDRDASNHLIGSRDRDLTALESTLLRMQSGKPNIAAIAWKAVCREVGMGLPVRIRILKRIPVSAGLGGGSGNAAAVLVALARLFDLDLTSHELTRLAAGIGADVPFFLSGGLMHGGHYGEELTDLGDCPPFHVIVLKPISDSNTAEAYAAIDGVLGLDDGISRAARTTRGFIAALRDGRDIFPHFRNDFDAQFMRNMDAGELFGWLQKRRADRVLIAGSGSAVVGVYREPPSPSLILAAMNEIGDFLECAFIARPISQGIEVVDWE